MPRPSDASPYSIERSGSFFAIRHDFRGIVLDEIESYGSAECHVDEMEAADAERAAEEAADAADDIAAPALFGEAA